MLSVWLSALAGGFLYFALHLTASGSFPRPLSAAQERECLQKIRQGDQQARDYFIEHNLRLVAHIIKKYYAAYKEQEDLISIGTIGLIKAVGTFNCEKGIRFATYASRCIENEILMYFRGRKKYAQDVYIQDPIDTDADGNALTLMDIMAQEGDILEDVDRRLKKRPASQIYPSISGPKGAAGYLPAIWPGGKGAYGPARGGRAFGNFPQLCVPHRKKGGGHSAQLLFRGIASRLLIKAALLLDLAPGKNLA